MKSPREARAAVIRAWDMLPPVSRMEIREASPELAAALDELTATVAALVDALRSGLDDATAWRPETDPAVTGRAPNNLKDLERGGMTTDTCPQCDGSGLD